VIMIVIVMVMILYDLRNDYYYDVLILANGLDSRVCDLVWIYFAKRYWKLFFGTNR
jgi:hypothetical protein